MIQNLISSGGQKAAEQRALQLMSHVNDVNASVQAPSSVGQGSTVQPFGEVLKATAKSQFGTL